jgi:diaminopropionate ammonia-lyase
MSVQVRWWQNPAGAAELPDAGFGPLSRAPLPLHASLPGYAPTPLRDLPAVAALLGVSRVLVKDESVRLELPSFKILGASWATVQALAARLGLDPAPTDLDAARRAVAGTGLHLVAATDGNHGRGVARMARLLGLGSTILVPAGTAWARVEAIASEGATVEVVPGSYDDAIEASAALADDRRVVVSDTSWPGYEDIPRAVVQGYSTMFHEIDDELARRGLPTPTVVALQAGVGAFASAGLRHVRARWAGARTVVVEPTSADCLQVSARNGELSFVPGPHPSAMAGLNCGRPSELVWPVVIAGTEVFVAIDDGWAEAAMVVLAAEGVVAGESGAASLGAALAAAADDELGRAFGLTADAVLLLVNTEGATDPQNYRRVVGRSPRVSTVAVPA